MNHEEFAVCGLFADQFSPDPLSRCLGVDSVAPCSDTAFTRWWVRCLDEAGVPKDAEPSRRVTQ